MTSLARRRGEVSAQIVAGRPELTCEGPGCYDMRMNKLERALKAYRTASSGHKSGDTRPTEDKVEQLSNDLRSVLESNGDVGGAEKAAKFLLLLGKSNAAEVFKHLSDVEVESITREIAEVTKIERGEAQDIFADFGFNRQRRLAGKGGEHVAKGILIRAFGETKGNAIFYKVVPVARDNPFGFLDNLEFQQILLLLRREPAQVVSVILPFLDAKKSSEILEALHPDKQLEVVKRIAYMREVSPDALLSMAEALREKIRKQGRLVTEEIDGVSALADILRYVSPSRERQILEYLDENNPEVGGEIRDKLLTLDVVLKIDNKSLQTVLREFSEEEIAVIIKGKDEGIQSHFLSSISERRKRFVEEEGIRLGPMKRSDVDKATKEFVRYLHDLAEDGSLVIRGDDEYLEV